MTAVATTFAGVTIGSATGNLLLRKINELTSADFVSTLEDSCGSESPA